MNSKSTANFFNANLIRTILFGGLIAGMYYSAFTWLIIKDWSKDDFGYCYFMPFVVAYLIWDRRAEFASCLSVPEWKGFVPLSLGLALFWLGELGGEYFTLYLSSWFVVVGLLWIHAGWKKLKTIVFAIFMCLTMFPFPNFLYNKISLKLQLISSQLGVSLMRVYGMSAHREGNIIDLAFTKLQVVEACSGLRSLMSLTVLGLLMVYFFRAVFWKRAVLLISVVPLSIFANSIRLALTGILYETWGRKAAEGFFHVFSGWVVFCFAFGLLLVEIWILNRLGGSRHSGTTSIQTEDTKNTSFEFPVSKIQGPPNKAMKAFFQPQFVAAFILLLSTLAFSQVIEFRENISISKPLDQFPLQINEWTGTRHSMDRKFINKLDLTDYAILDYSNPEGKSINLYVAYYETQRKGESIHSPASCLPGSGWFFRQADQATVSTPGYYGGTIKVNRAFMEKMGHKQLSYFWFPQRGRILTNAYQLKWYVFLDALTKQRTDGALVRLIAPVSDTETLNQAESRIQEFTRQIIPILAEFIPGEEIQGN
jgi:exosortase D (VPLPA-CTERM-specific)